MDVFRMGILKCIVLSIQFIFSDNRDGSIIPCVYIKSKTPARYTIVYSHANAEDLGYL